MTDKEIKECIDDSEIYQSTVDSLVDELHDLISVGNISDAKIIADQIRELRPVG
jgi:protein-arginine kinase activator protein McsA